MYTKDLIGFNKKCKVITAARKDILFNVKPDDNLDKLLNKFIRKKVHLAFVIDDFGVLHGIVTLEDVLEEILQKEIMDEEDEHPDLRKVAERQNNS